MLLKNNTMKLALCGMLTALCTAVMFFTGLIPAATYALPATAGLLIIVAVIEVGTAWAWPVYIASSVLSLLLAVDKEAVAIYILFFGYYPIIKAYTERKKKGKLITFFFKVIVFNAAMILDFYVSVFILGVPKDSFTIFGVYLPWLLLILMNFVFFLYDYAISNMVLIYFQRLHPFVLKWFRLK